MDRIKVEILAQGDPKVIVTAARTCYDSFDKSTPAADSALLERLWKSGHHSVFEHFYFTFHVSGCSRACLQEIVRHRIASYSVQSTRFTLRRFLQRLEASPQDEALLRQFFVFPPLPPDELDCYLADLRKRLEVLLDRSLRLPNDKLKYYLPESWRTTFVWTINLRSLANFLTLRLSPRAHFEIRHLATLVAKQVKAKLRFAPLLDWLNIEV